MHTKNQLLVRLSNDVLNRLKSDLHPVTLAHGKVLHKPGDDIETLYFPLTCMISITVALSDGTTVEVGAVGSREVVGVNAFMGGSETTHTEYVVQLSGDALKIAAAPLRNEFDTNVEFRSVMLNYTQALIAQISQNVACNRLHQIERRCARWLLEVRERVQSDEFNLTQEFLSQMLGCSRPTVSTSLTDLREKNIVTYSRGNMKILDSGALLDNSCECYKVLQDEFLRLLGANEKATMPLL